VPASACGVCAGPLCANALHLCARVFPVPARVLCLHLVERHQMKVNAQWSCHGPATRPVSLPGCLHRIFPFVCACFAPVCAYLAICLRVCHPVCPGREAVPASACVVLARALCARVPCTCLCVLSLSLRVYLVLQWLDILNCGAYRNTIDSRSSPE